MAQNNVYIYIYIYINNYTFCLEEDLSKKTKQSTSHQSSVLTLASVTARIDFKVLLLVYKSLNGLGPKYMQICSLNINLTEHSDQ